MSKPSAMKAALVPPWWPRYRKDYIRHDVIAGLIVALMLIPQGLAYATLAGVPPQYGLYASLLPVVLYALFGSSAVMSVGPVAITSLLTASALAALSLDSVTDYVAASALLALASGIFLFAAGLLRLGAVAQLLSHPVVNAFISGAALLIIISQMKPLLGLQFAGHSTIENVSGLANHLSETNPFAAIVGVVSLAVFILSRKHTVPLLSAIGLSRGAAVTVQRMMPMLMLLLGALLVYLFDWQNSMAVVGELPRGTPSFSIPEIRSDWLAQLWLPAIVIGLLGFVESISIAQSFAQKARQPLDANAELRGLGAANIGSALASGFPVTGGFSRTLVNADAGAHSPLSGIFSAGFVLLSLWFATELFAYLPITILAATIIAAALQLVNAGTFLHAWRYDRAEAAAMFGTASGVLLLGVEAGIAIGVALSIMTVVWRTSRPHIAVVGLVPGTEHFRNVNRHQVETSAQVLMVRIDENLVFANAEPVSRELLSLVERSVHCTDLVLLMSSVSRIDVTAVEMLEHLNEELQRRDIRLHLAEVKGPVSDQLNSCSLPQRLSGKTFLTAYLAFKHLTEPDKPAL